MNNKMGKTRLLVSAVLMLICVSGYSQYRDTFEYADLYDSENVAAMKEHVRTLSSAMMEGRAPGSEGERMAAEYVESQFEKYGLDILSPADGDVFGLRSTADGRRAEICDRVALCVLRLATANPTPCAKTNKDCYGCAAVKMKNKKYKASSTSLHFTYYIRHSRPHDFTDAEQQPATIHDFTPTKNPGAALRAVIRE